MNKCFTRLVSSPLMERLFIVQVTLHIKVTCDF
uniref:Uncharacterized protein n=1 Tax=Lepeophtheirus salmonis TaxID=72036 RepID=A0A0K2SYV6_LEPSM